MTQSELVKQLTELTGLHEQGVQSVLKSFFQIVENTDHLQIKGFGTFKKVTVAARTARNPRTGEPLQIPEKVKLTFKASKKA